MGGCRCVYQNCTMSKDKSPNTHFFHFPVFDRQRCCKWVVNSKRPDLLDLKVSQLKNRVICENHFRDDMFMNTRKNKLKPDAIPNPGEPPNYILPDEKPNEIDPSLNIDLAADESKFFTPREKIALFSVPYNDFLSKLTFEAINDPGLTKSLPKPNNENTVLRYPVVFPINNTNSKVHIEKKKNNDITTNNGRKLIKQNPNVVILSEEKVKKEIYVNPEKMKTVLPSFKIPVTKPRGKRIYEETVNETSNIKQENSEKINPLAPSLTPSITKQSGKIIYEHTTNENLNAEQENISENFPPIDDTNLLITNNNQIKNLNIEEIESSCILVNDLNYTKSQQKGDLVTQKPFQCVNVLKPPPIVFEEITKEASLPVIDNEQHPKVSFSPQETQNTNPQTQFSYVTPKNDQCPPEQPKRAHQEHSSHFSGIHKSKNSCRRSHKMSSLSAALLAKVNENSRDIAEIKQILLKKVREPIVKPISSKLVSRNFEERKKYLFQEISHFISTDLKNDLYEEMFLNYSRKRRRNT